MKHDARSLARATIAHHSKSFSLAAKLLPARCRDDAMILYAWCRRADDAIDLAPPEDQPAAVARLRAELDDMQAERRLDDPILDATADVVRARSIPFDYLRELVAGMEMDARNERYEQLDDLLLYCFRVAGTVGLMMAHVMGARDARALRHAVHLGIAMQLTNICRDVAEDRARGRVYLPLSMLRENTEISSVVRVLLREADRHYASADRGLDYLAWRCAIAVRAAREVYAAIGRRLARRGFDPFRGRAVVPGIVKIWIVLRVIVRAWIDLLPRVRRPFVPAPLPRVTFPHDVPPLGADA